MSKTQLQRVTVKSLDSQFVYVLENHFEFSPKQAAAIVETANDIYQLQHYDPAVHIANNKIARTVISKKAKHGPKLEDLPKVQIALTKSINKEDKQLFRIEDKASLRRVKILRMTEEALDQGGLLTQEDLADILEVSTRGTYQDIGPGVSHKSKIVKLFLEYNTYSDIQRKTRHSPAAIKRYITNFSQVLLATKNNLSIKETAHIVGISEKLTKEYVQLYLKYNTKENKERLADIVKIADKKALVQTEAKKGAQK